MNQSRREALIGDLYETVLVPERVPEVLRAINASMDCDGIHLIGWQEDSGVPIVSVVTSPHIASAEKAYLEHYTHIDPRREMGVRRPVGAGGSCHDFFDDAFVHRDEFYQDFLIPLGPRYVYGGNVLRQENKLVCLVFNHLVGRPRFTGAKRQALDRWMVPLTRWMTHLVQTEGLRQAAAMGEWAVEAIDRGLVFFDGQGRLLHANRMAVQLLGDRLRRPQLGQHGASPLASSLMPLVRSVATSRQALRFRMDGIRQTGLVVGVLPIARETYPIAGTGLGQLASSPASGALPLGAEVVLTLEPALLPGPPTLGERAKRWGLTPAEHRLLAALVEGHSVIDHARREGVKESTMRTHARALLEKTHATSLKHLLSTLAR